jgi:DNA-binding CsgD family transcriptional regulator
LHDTADAAAISRSNCGAYFFEALIPDAGVFVHVETSMTQRSLEPTELEALKLFANGKTADEMAAALAMSKSMAQYYLRVARKLGARNRVHAVALAVKMGLVNTNAAHN